MNVKDKSILFKLLNRINDLNLEVLDYGCGIGDLTKCLLEKGYKKITSVDISYEMVEKTKLINPDTFHINELKANNKFDLVILSHVIEHIEYKNLQPTLENIFMMCKQDAYILIITPTLHPSFFNDIDHIKPYFPRGILTLFSDLQVSKQYQSKFQLRLIDIFFRKEPLVPYNLRSRYIKGFLNNLIFRIANWFFLILQKLSLGIFSRATAYGALFQLNDKKN